MLAIRALYEAGFERGDGQTEELAERIGVKLKTLVSYASHRGWTNPKRGGVSRQAYLSRPKRDPEVAEGLKRQELMRMWR